MSNVIKAASTDQYTSVKLWTVADGLPKTNAAYNTSGLSIKYQIGNAAVQSVTVGGSPAPASMSAGGAHADWGIYHRGNGWYVIGIADAVVATAGNRVSVWIELTSCDSAPSDIYVAGYDGSLEAVGAGTSSSLATVAGYLDTEIAAILADTNELQTDWANGGRLDVILDTAAAGVTVVPLTGVVESRIDGTTISVFTSETLTVSVVCVDAEGNAVNISAMNLEIIIENQRTADIVVIANASITKVSSTFSFAVPISVSGTEGNYRWALRKTTDDTVLMTGPFIVAYAPQGD